MKSVLVTGLIGSGKSALCRELERRGYPVYDSDSRTKALYASVPGLESRIVEATGLDFAHLGEIFSDAGKLERLEAIVHPLVRSDFERFALASGSPIVFFESAIAADKSYFDGAFDKVVLVRAPRDLRVSRNPKAAVRSAFQSEPSHYDILIENNGSLEELYDRIDLLLKQL